MRLKSGVSARAAHVEPVAIQKRVDRQFVVNPKGFDIAIDPLNTNNTLLIRRTLFTLTAAIFAVFACRRDSAAT